MSFIVRMIIHIARYNFFLITFFILTGPYAGGTKEFPKHGVMDHPVSCPAHELYGYEIHECPLINDIMHVRWMLKMGPTLKKFEEPKI